MTISRRTFGQSMAVAFALAVAGRMGRLHAGARTHEIVINDFAFVPADLTVAPGDVVVWTNADLAPHTATAVAGDWTTGEIAGGRAASVMFEIAAEHDYVCAFHPRMTGRIRVVAPPG